MRNKKIKFVRPQCGGNFITRRWKNATPRTRKIIRGIAGVAGGVLAAAGTLAAGNLYQAAYLNKRRAEIIAKNRYNRIMTHSRNPGRYI
jgi:hypothetical protein